ncbi:MAG: PAS domain-containing protein [Thalassobaculaceae bacterium]|nr:PAS domain-containing protein [Thalassobaculaceae bacterium]
MTSSGKPRAPGLEPVAGPVGICADIFDHWRGLCGTGGTPASVPTRDQIDLLTIPKSTREHFFLIERRDDRYLVRLASTRLIDNMGAETTGKYLDQLMRPEVYPARRALFDRCTGEGVPVYYGATLAAATREHIAFRRILLPMRGTGGTDVNLVCGVMDFVSAIGFSDVPVAGAMDRPTRENRTNGMVFRLIFKDGAWINGFDN